ncbi:hypothetical protein CKF54_06135 [Psittacicella hinzii]|uniref:Helicase ATP-binding domain-containing protein n=1 Tax=Psittacicella hinzii TaxID=2028575 RepID=A0A3A1Y0B8_9GAMM|nr:helicase C-terminal domain-containing protein [Psittacicella hinzii]RIY31762.1 hypothetical protein CKF54_06135 [Psittacicella hinzii]
MTLRSRVQAFFVLLARLEGDKYRYRPEQVELSCAIANLIEQDGVTSDKDSRVQQHMLHEIALQNKLNLKQAQEVFNLSQYFEKTLSFAQDLAFKLVSLEHEDIITNADESEEDLEDLQEELMSHELHLLNDKLFIDSLRQQVIAQCLESLSDADLPEYQHLFSEINLPATKKSHSKGKENELNIIPAEEIYLLAYKALLNTCYSKKKPNKKNLKSQVEQLLSSKKLYELSDRKFFDKLYDELEAKVERFDFPSINLEQQSNNRIVKIAIKAFTNLWQTGLKQDLNTLIREAPTGTGKSLAYLVPILMANRHAVIATYMKSLQEQLNREVPGLIILLKKIQRKAALLQEQIDVKLKELPEKQAIEHRQTIARNRQELEAQLAKGQVVQDPMQVDLRALDLVWDLSHLDNSKFLVLKGQTNYLCPRALHYFIEPQRPDIPLPSQDEPFAFLPDYYVRNYSFGNKEVLVKSQSNRAIITEGREVKLPLLLLNNLYDWYNSTNDYTKLDFENIPRQLRISEEQRALLFLNRKECSFNSCAFAHACPYLKVRQQAQSARIIVANHHVLLSAVEAEILDQNERIIVVDEAHNLPQVLINSSENRFSPEEMTNLLTDIQRDFNDGELSLSQDDLYALQAEHERSLEESLELYLDSKTIAATQAFAQNSPAYLPGRDYLPVVWFLEQEIAHLYQGYSNKQAYATIDYFATYLQQSLTYQANNDTLLFKNNLAIWAKDNLLPTLFAQFAEYDNQPHLSNLKKASQFASLSALTFAHNSEIAVACQSTSSSQGNGEQTANGVANSVATKGKVKELTAKQQAQAAQIKSQSPEQVKQEQVQEGQEASLSNAYQLAKELGMLVELDEQDLADETTNSQAGTRLETTSQNASDHSTSIHNANTNNASGQNKEASSQASTFTKSKEFTLWLNPLNLPLYAESLTKRSNTVKGSTSSTSTNYKVERQDQLLTLERDGSVAASSESSSKGKLTFVKRERLNPAYQAQLDGRELSQELFAEGRALLEKKKLQALQELAQMRLQQWQKYYQPLEQQLADFASYRKACQQVEQDFFAQLEAQEQTKGKTPLQGEKALAQLGQTSKRLAEALALYREQPSIALNPALAELQSCLEAVQVPASLAELKLNPLLLEGRYKTLENDLKLLKQAKPLAFTQVAGKSFSKAELESLRSLFNLGLQKQLKGLNVEFEILKHSIRNLNECIQYIAQNIHYKEVKKNNVNYLNYTTKEYCWHELAHNPHFMAMPTKEQLIYRQLRDETDLSITPAWHSKNFLLPKQTNFWKKVEPQVSPWTIVCQIKSRLYRLVALFAPALRHKINELQSSLSDDKSSKNKAENARLAKDINDYENKLESLLLLNELFEFLSLNTGFTDYRGENYAYVFVDINPHSPRINFHLKRLKADQAFNNLRVKLAKSKWVLTSATLSIGQDCTRYCQTLGIKYADVGIVASPFRHHKRAYFYVQQGSRQTVTSDTVELIYNNQGRCLWLCTSNHRVRQVSKELQNQLDHKIEQDIEAEYLRKNQLPTKTEKARELEKRRFKVLFQDREISNNFLVESLRDDEKTIVVATRSFWEGVDIKGDKLSLLILDKYPNPQLNAYYNTLSNIYQPGYYFDNYYNPDGYIVFKQGIGRLIRSEEDFGLIMLLDPQKSNYLQKIMPYDYPNYVLDFQGNLPQALKFLAEQKEIYEANVKEREAQAKD